MSTSPSLGILAEKIKTSCPPEMADNSTLTSKWIRTFFLPFWSKLCHFLKPKDPLSCPLGPEATRLTSNLLGQACFGWLKITLADPIMCSPSPARNLPLGGLSLAYWPSANGLKWLVGRTMLMLELEPHTALISMPAPSDPTINPSIVRIGDHCHVILSCLI